MFKWLRSRAASPDLDDVSRVLKLSDERYTAFVKVAFDQMEPALRAHILVAYCNLVPLVSAMYSHDETKSYTIESLITELAPKLKRNSDEISSRRVLWFLLAGLLARLEKMARRYAPALETAAEIWCKLAADSIFLKGLLPHNIVWQPDEKVWFELNKSDNDLVQYVVNFTIPPQLARTNVVKKFAADRGLLYMPSDFRIGIIP